MVEATRFPAIVAELIATSCPRNEQGRYPEPERLLEKHNNSRPFHLVLENTSSFGLLLALPRLPVRRLRSQSSQAAELRAADASHLSFPTPQAEPPP
jgi:hypothetical protein